MSPELLRYELDEGEDSSRPDGGERVGGAGEEEIEEAEADRIALVV
jgi:hypothetical protein